MDYIISYKSHDGLEFKNEKDCGLYELQSQLQELHDNGVRLFDAEYNLIPFSVFKEFYFNNFEPDNYGILFEFSNWKKFEKEVVRSVKFIQFENCTEDMIDILMDLGVIVDEQSLFTFDIDMHLPCIIKRFDGSDLSYWTDEIQQPFDIWVDIEECHDEMNEVYKTIAIKPQTLQDISDYCTACTSATAKQNAETIIEGRA